MKKLNLNDFFYELTDESYCIIKTSSIDSYQSGSDIDIFCFDIKKCAKCILKAANKYIQHGYEVKMHEKTSEHAYVDFILDRKIDFRFDLYGKLPDYKNLMIKDSLFSSVIENRVNRKQQADNKKYDLYFASDNDELILRYIEYMEWYERRPDKIKHLDFILDAVKNDKNSISFLDRLHYYTKVPDIYGSIKKVKKSYLGYLLGKSKGKTFPQVIKAGFRFIFRRRKK